MRGLTEWIGNFFKPASPIIKYKIAVSPGNFSQYLKETLLTYDEICFNNFDFRKENRQMDFQKILSMLDKRFIFLNAEFTPDQINTLLEKKFDLSRSTYRVYPAITMQEYKILFAIAKKNNLPSSLHGVYVDFNAADLRRYPPDFLSRCHPFSLIDTKISQSQFDLLTQKKMPLSLNLTGISLSKINISDCIRLHEKIISFSPYCPTSGQNTICFSKTTLQNAIIDSDVLALFAEKVIFHDWFTKLDLTITVKFKDHPQFSVNIEKLLSNIEAAAPAIPTKNPGMWSGNNAAETLKNYISVQVNFSEPVNLTQYTQGEKFLWLMHCVVNDPQSELSRNFFEVHQPIIIPSLRTTANSLW